MNMAGIVLWCVAMGAAFTFVNGLGLFSVALANPGAPTAAQFLPAASCKVTETGIPYDCTGNVNSPGAVVGTVFTFGYFLWSFVQAIPSMITGALVPGTLAAQWFGGIGIVVNAVLFFLFALWAWSVVGNRKGDFSPE